MSISKGVTRTAGSEDELDMRKLSDEQWNS
jgi:hypothetical protein